LTAYVYSVMVEVANGIVPEAMDVGVEGVVGCAKVRANQASQTRHDLENGMDG